MGLYKQPFFRVKPDLCSEPTNGTLRRLLEIATTNQILLFSGQLDGVAMVSPLSFLGCLCPVYKIG